jgi:hypothetical protein
MKRLFILSMLAMLFCFFSFAQAADKVVVIPLNSKQPANAVGQEITSLPYIISSPGFYYLGGNLDYAGIENAITVNADEVTIDLMGNRIASTNEAGFRKGIYMHGRKNVEIRNGSISDFSVGIFEDSAAAIGHNVNNIRALRNYVAISLSGTNHMVMRCTASNNSSDGIYVNEGIVSECTAQGGNNRGIDIVNGLIKNCYAVSNRIGFQILSGAAIGNVAINNEHYGFLIGSDPALPVMMDQNSAINNGTNYSGGTPTWGTNAGL